MTCVVAVLVFATNQEENLNKFSFSLGTHPF
jgi:hypothetical protein